MDAATNPELLIRRARAGDTEALGGLFALYRNYLKLLARLQIDQRLQAKADASDIVQQLFLHAHQGFADFRGGTEPELLVWLRRILATTLAKNARRYLGTRQRQLDLERRLEHELDKTSQALDVRLIQSNSPSQSALRREQGVLLAEALAQLPDDYRNVIVLRYLENQTFPEIAHKLDRSVDSVRKLWTRGLARLRDLAEQLDG